MGRLTEKVTLIVLLNRGAVPQKIRIPRWTAKYWRTILTLIGGILIVAAAAIVFLVLQLVQLQGVKTDNEYLLAENAQINRIASEFARLKQLNYQIRKSLGVNIGLEPIDPVTADTTKLGLLETPMHPTTVMRPVSVTGETAHDLPAWLAQGFTSRDVPSFLPVEGFVTQEFRCMEWAGDANSKFKIQNSKFLNHPGIDIAASVGTPILAAADGIVTFSDWTYRYGNLIIVSHRSGYFTVYGHAQLNTCHVRDWVRQGEPIGLVGNSGVSTAPHLHFEIWKGTKPVNPRDYIWGLAGSG
jgi:murein DD-endopeptidase MepM/ murein hydrolase activator NlpD